MCKITIIGGGSSKFVRELVGDVLSLPALERSHVCLMDIDQARVERSHKLVQKIIDTRDLQATVESTTSQKAAVEGADYIICTIMVGGFKHYESDTFIPAKYGVNQAVGDTIGPGGVFRIIRTAPVLKELVENTRALAPSAWILNYANPMAMNCWTMRDCGYDRVVGLCHSIQSAYRWIAGQVGVPPDEVVYTAAGINHVNFYLTLQHRGQDLYPALKAASNRIIEKEPARRVQLELVDRMGLFPAEGPAHQVEYYPWFKRQTPEEVKHYAVETGWGFHWDSYHNGRLDKMVADYLAGGDDPFTWERSVEYGANIMNALETGLPYSFYGNVPNRGLIENLPPEAIVEVPCLADSNGIFPCRMGKIPAQIAAVITPHVAVHEMAVGGALTKSRRLITQAIQADPLTGAVLDLSQIGQMVDELFVENRDYVKDWPIG